MVAAPSPAHSRLTGLLGEVGATVDELNELGLRAALLFQRLDKQRAQLADDHGLSNAGGLHPVMQGGYDVWKRGAGKRPRLRDAADDQADRLGRIIG